MNLISLSAFDLSLAAGLMVLLALVSILLQLGLASKIILYSIRMTAQLFAIGLVLKFLFDQANPWLVILLSMVMLSVAGVEVRSIQKFKIVGVAGYGIGTTAMFVSSFSITLLALFVIIRVDPWYTPQYAIPLLGMMLGNTMNGIALSIDRLTSLLYEQRMAVEQRLLLGQTWQEASVDIRKDCMRTGMIPIINSMAAAGVVSLPGMMTGQILGGTQPVDAVKYQILIMFLIAAGTGFGVVCAIWFIGRYLFDDRHRLRLDRLKR